MSEALLQHKKLVEEEIHDLENYLAGIPELLRASGAFAAYESRLALLTQQLSSLQKTRQAPRNVVGPQPQIFLNYASEDRSQVSGLYQQLSAKGFKPWMDYRDIGPGSRWSPIIDRTIRNSHFFLVCLSTNSITKTGVIERERDMALGIQQLFPFHVPYLIPVRLEPCEIPQKLHDLQWINFFEEDGFHRLCAEIERGMKQRFSRGRGASRKRSADDHSIVIQGALVFSIYPAAREVSVSARLCPEAPGTFVHPRKLEEIEERFEFQLPFYGGGRYPMYDLGFMLPGGHLVSAENGFAVPEDWPFEEEDVRLGSDITAQFSLTFTYDGSLTVRRRRR